MEKPKLRNISARPVTINGSPMILLEDPDHISDQTLCISNNEVMIFILGQLDGNHTILEIQADFMRQFGSLLMTDQINGIVRKLDENHFLENEEFHRFQKTVMEDFRKSPTRPSSLAGVSYSNNPQNIDILLDSMIEAGRQSTRLDDSSRGKNPRAIISPHIDFMRGGRVYGAVYDTLPRERRPDLLVIFGTLHTPATRLCIPTRKSFETPLGTARTDTDILDELEKDIPPDLLYRDEFSHRREHSIEFQVLWLQYLYRNREGISILPILCSSFENHVNRGIPPDRDDEFATFIQSLKAAIGKTGKDVFYIAGADFSHIGPSFGDYGPVTPDLLHETRKRDGEVLEAVCKGDPNLFFDQIAGTGDRYRICGLPPVYTMLKIMGPGQGILVDYDQSLDPERTTSVSFAGVAYF